MVLPLFQQGPGAFSDQTGLFLLNLTSFLLETLLLILLIFAKEPLSIAAMAWLSRLAITAAQSLRCVSRFSGRQGYGSAAAVQFDYDYYDDCYSEAEEDYGQLNRFNPNLESVPGSASGRGVQWVLIGDPGAKKHVYAEKLSKLLEVPHISMGTLLRQELNLNSSVYKQIAIAVNEGKLVPEDVIFGLLSKRLEEGYNRGENGFILDGIPRTRIQAEILDQIADIDLVVNFKCGEGNLVKRNLLSAENSSYSVADAGSVSNEKFRIYAQEGKALEGYYRKQQKLLDFQVAGGSGETWQGLLAALHLKNLSAARSSPKLAA